MVTDLRDLILLGAEYVGNRNWMGQCPDVYHVNFQRMEERQEEIEQLFQSLLGNTKAKNLIKQLQEHMI
jgi:hypothetical protein